jgi:hypothetical protein
MINLSVDTRNLSHSLSEEFLEEVFCEMTFLVESSFDVSVEEIYGDVSYWTPTPDDEIEELEIFGIIDIGDETSALQKIIHLTHEVGHVIYDMDELFKNVEDTMFCEATAWFLGYHFMAEHGYTIEMSEYQKEMKYAIKLYRWSENARDVE